LLKICDSSQCSRLLGRLEVMKPNSYMKQNGMATLTPRDGGSMTMTLPARGGGVAVPGFGHIASSATPLSGARGGLAAVGGSMVRSTPRGGMLSSRQQDHGKARAACLGVIRLDYDYPPAPGDIDHPGSFGYDVYYRVVPGLTFAMCQKGKMTPAVEKEFVEAIAFLESKQVSGITGDCGFMMYFQQLARRHTTKPVFLSALAQLPAVVCAFNAFELIAVFTANGASLHPMRSLIKDECGVDPEEKRFIIVGCEDVPGFEAVAAGEKVDVQKVTPGMVTKALQVLKKHPQIRALLMECTELPPYSDALRRATGLPVYDAITGCDFFLSGRLDNKRFGVNDWQAGWDQEQESYKFGANLSKAQQGMLVNKIS